MEDYSHYFRTCIFFKDFFGKIKELLKKSGIENDITLYHLVFGYKIFDKNYYDFNYFLTIIGFSIYKAYYISEQKKKRLDVYSLFVREYLRIYRGNEIIQKSSFSEKTTELFVNYLNMNHFNIIVSQISLYLYYLYIYCFIRSLRS